MKYLQNFVSAGLVAIAGLSIAGCESVTAPKGPLSPDFGNAVRHNMAVQVVDPEASAGITEPPGLEGNRAEAAMTLYQEGETEAVEQIRTTDVGN